MKFDILFTETYSCESYKDKLKLALIYIIPDISKETLYEIDNAYYQYIISVCGTDDNEILYSDDIINAATLLKQNSGFIIDFKNNEEYNIIYDYYHKHDYCYSFISRKDRKLLVINNELYIIPITLYIMFFEMLEVISFPQYLRSIKIKHIL